ncbi:MAG: response regulator transcription factor [Gilvibacter sp.]
MTHTVVVVDDHTLLGQAIGQMVSGFTNFEFAYHCPNGEELLKQLTLRQAAPAVILMDINMPIMDGIEATKIVSEKYPDTKILALSVEHDDTTILNMLRAGAHGYLLKDTKKNNLEMALEQLIENGYYHTNTVAKLLVNSLQKPNIIETLKPREREFMVHACSELNYREIAQIMCVSPKTIEGYRDALYEKLNIKNRIGLVLFAIKHKIIAP